MKRPIYIDPNALQAKWDEIILGIGQYCDRDEYDGAIVNATCMLVEAMEAVNDALAEAGYPEEEE